MKAPDKIYLQIGDDVLPEEFDELNTEGITWSAVKIHENDLEFVSVEKIRELMEKYREDIENLITRYSNGPLRVQAQSNIDVLEGVFEGFSEDLTALIEGE